MKPRTLKVMLASVAAVSIAASASAGIDFGNALVPRDYASDFPVGLGGSAPVLVIPAVVLPEGTLNGFDTYDQVEPGGSPFASAGNTFTAYILRPTGFNTFTEVFNSGLLTVPAVTSSGVVDYAVGSFHTQAGDRIAYYGQGVPVTITGSGTDTLVYPAGPAPGLNTTFTLGSAGFPIYPQNRFYSFAADVTPVPEPSTCIAGALLLLPFGISTFRNLRKK